MKATWAVAAAGALLFAGVAGGQAPTLAPTAPPAAEWGVLVDVSVGPVTEVPLVIVPGDRTDKPAFVVEILVTSGVGLGGPTPAAWLAHKQLVVFAGEETNGSFKGADLTVVYRIKVRPEERTADASVRVSRDGRFVGGSRTHVKITVPQSGLKPAPGK